MDNENDSMFLISSLNQFSFISFPYIWTYVTCKSEIAKRLASLLFKEVIEFIDVVSNKHITNIFYECKNLEQAMIIADLHSNEHF